MSDDRYTRERGVAGWISEKFEEVYGEYNGGIYAPAYTGLFILPRNGVTVVAARFSGQGKGESRGSGMGVGCQYDWEALSDEAAMGAFNSGDENERAIAWSYYVTTANGA